MSETKSNNPIPINDWLAELEKLVDAFPPDSGGGTLRGLYGPKLDEEAWKIFYDDGYSPQEALDEDLSYL